MRGQETSFAPGDNRGIPHDTLRCDQCYLPPRKIRRHGRCGPKYFCRRDWQMKRLQSHRPPRSDRMQGKLHIMSDLRVSELWYRSLDCNVVPEFPSAKCVKGYEF